MDRSHKKKKIKELDDQSKTCRPPHKVTIQELNKTIRQLKNNKAPGPDKIPNEIFINANQTISHTTYQINGKRAKLQDSTRERAKKENALMKEE